MAGNRLGRYISPAVLARERLRLVPARKRPDGKVDWRQEATVRIISGPRRFSTSGWETVSRWLELIDQHDWEGRLNGEWRADAG